MSLACALVLLSGSSRQFTDPLAGAAVAAEGSSPDSNSRIPRTLPSHDLTSRELAADPAPGEDEAFDEMLRRSSGPWQHWPVAPELVVLTSVMEYHSGPTKHYRATSETLSDDEVDTLVSDLTTALRLLTDHTFETFAAIRREPVASGTSVAVVRPGQIVVGRYRGVNTLTNTIGFGGRRAQRDGTITSAAIVLDSHFDRTSPSRALLRAHELGHALGYNHVRSRVSIMNERLGPELTEFDRQVARFAFRRLLAADGR